MKEYTTTQGQSIYDIALILYGSIEGIFDLLVNNNISINDEIPAGTVLSYDEDFIINQGIMQWLGDNKTNVANEGEYINGDDFLDLGLRIIVNQNGATSVIAGSLSSGSMIIDWGDGSRADIVNGTAGFEFDHPYKDDGRHVIRIFGDFQLRTLDFRELFGIYYAVSNCRVSGRFLESTNRDDLMTLFR